MSDPTPGPSAPRPLFVVGAIALALASTFLIFRSTAVRRGLAPARPADYAWTLADLDGRPVDFARYRGKPVFLNIWATWCPPCVAEMPSIAALSQRAKVKGVEFVCVSIDDDAVAPRRFAEQNSLPLTVLWSGGRLPPVFQTDGIPATFIIAPDGRIVRSEVGSADWDTAEVVELLEGLAKPASGG